MEGEIVETPKINLSLADLKKKSYKGNFDKIVSDLKNGFMRGFTVEQACTYAGLSKETYYQWLKLSDEFVHDMDLAKGFPIRRCKEVVMDKIDQGDVNTARWYLEKKAIKEFGDSGTGNVNVQVNVSNYEKYKKDKIKNINDETELQRLASQQIRDERESQN